MILRGLRPDRPEMLAAAALRRESVVWNPYSAAAHSQLAYTCLLEDPSTGGGRGARRAGAEPVSSLDDDPPGRGRTETGQAR